MKQRFITRISDGQSVDLAKLNRKKLQRLHYEEEKYVANKIRELPSFSQERKELMQQGYDLVNEIMKWYLPETNISYGAQGKTVELVCRLLNQNKEKKLLFEAGVGTGFSCESFIKQPNVTVRGCDVLVSDKVRQLTERYSNIIIDEDTLYNSLQKMEDNSIEYFYADNVFEHLLPDEFPQILNSLFHKMKKGGILILVIPNRLTGPGDVSKYFIEQGKPAEGFHFMEMSYSETLRKFKRFGIVPEYFIWRDKRNNLHYVSDKSEILNKIKIQIERLLSLYIKNPEQKKKLFYKMALTHYVLIKNDIRK